MQICIRWVLPEAVLFILREFKTRRDIYSFQLDPKPGAVTSAPARVATPFEGNSALPEYSPDGNYLAMIERGQAGKDPRN